MKELLIKYVPMMLAFVGGILIKHFIGLYFKKISKLQYEITHIFLGASSKDIQFGKVEVLYNGEQVNNLYLTKITIRNTSNTDFNDLKISLWCDSNSTILVSNVIKSDTINPIQLTKDYVDQITNEKEESVRKLLLAKRDYSIEVFNRDDELTFSCLAKNAKGEQPGIYLNCEHNGLKLKADFVKPQYFLGERTDVSTLLGWLICIGLLILIIYYLSSSIWVGISAFLLGSICIFPGVLALKVHKIIKNILR